MNILKVIILLMIIPFVSGQALDFHTAKYNIGEEEVLVDIYLEFSKYEDEIFFYSLPVDVNEVSVFVNDELIEFDIIEHSIDIPGEGLENLRVIYLTKIPLEKGKNRFFIEKIEALYQTSRLEVSVTLPEKAILDTSIEEGGSVFPDPSDLKTDGQRISLVWVRENLEKGDDLPLFVMFKEESNSMFYLVGLVVILIGLIVYWKYKPKRTRIKTVTKKIPELHLKEDEKVVVRILKKKEGQCYQSTIALLSNFSKAHLSRILQEMEDRKIIKKVQKGKKNIVILKSEEWNLDEI